MQAQRSPLATGQRFIPDPIPAVVRDDRDRRAPRRTSAPGQRRQPRQRQQDARRRLRLIRRRRLDLLQDVTLALVLSVFTLIESAGLGVVALLCLLAVAVLAATVVVERTVRRRRRR